MPKTAEMRSQHVTTEAKLPMLARCFNPVLIGAAGRQAKNEPALFFRQPPLVGDGQEGPQAGRTQFPAICRRKSFQNDR